MWKICFCIIIDCICWLNKLKWTVSTKTVWNMQCQYHYSETSMTKYQPFDGTIECNFRMFTAKIYVIFIMFNKSLYMKGKEAWMTPTTNRLVRTGDGWVWRKLNLNEVSSKNHDFPRITWFPNINVLYVNLFILYNVYQLPKKMQSTYIRVKESVMPVLRFFINLYFILVVQFEE